MHLYDKVALFIGDPRLIPVMNMLHHEKRLAAVIIHHSQVGLAQQLPHWCQQEDILCLVVDGEYTEEQLNYLRASEPFMGLALGFERAWLEAASSHMSDGIYRLGVMDLAVTSGLSSPFWILTKKSSSCQLVLERIHNNEHLFCVLREITISDLDTYAYLENRLFTDIEHLVYQYIKNLESDVQLHWHRSAGTQECSVSPSAIDVQINWAQHTAKDISALARASNPQHGCMLTLNNVQIGVLEATPCDFMTWQVEAGTVCHSGGADGLIVATRDGAVRLDVLSCGDGIFSAKRFSEKFAIEAGMQFSS